MQKIVPAYLFYHCPHPIFSTVLRHIFEFFCDFFYFSLSLINLHFFMHFRIIYSFSVVMKLRGIAAPFEGGGSAARRWWGSMFSIV